MSPKHSSKSARRFFIQSFQRPPHHPLDAETDHGEQAQVAESIPFSQRRAVTAGLVFRLPQFRRDRGQRGQLVRGALAELFPGQPGSCSPTYLNSSTRSSARNRRMSSRTIRLRST